MIMHTVMYTAAPETPGFDVNCITKNIGICFVVFLFSISNMLPPSPPLGAARPAPPRNNDAEVMQTNNDAAVSRLCVPRVLLTSCPVSRLRGQEFCA